MPTGVERDWRATGSESPSTELRQRLEVLPEVTRAALVSRLPAQPSGTTTIEVEGYTPAAGTNGVELPVALVSDEYFETMGIPLLQGRLFNRDDVPGGERMSIVINEAAARRFWGNANPLGRRMRAQGTEAWTRTVVGVVADVPVARLGESPRPMFYRSTRQLPVMPGYVVVRTDGDPGGNPGLHAPGGERPLPGGGDRRAGYDGDDISARRSQHRA